MPMLQSLADKDELNEVVKNCVVKSCELMDAGVPLHLNGFVKTHDAGAIRAEYEACSATELEELNESFTCAGRIISHRSFGKVAFFHLMDRSGRIQCYASKDLMGEEAYKNFKKFDIGDIVGVHGKLFRTKTDELTLACDQVTLLTKSFRSLPEKHKGLTNVEIRYRQRYVDLITNPKVRDIFRKRSKIIRTFRAFLEERGFVEVETPMLHPVAGGAAARPFITHHNALDMELYMRIAPELYLKRLLVGGFEKVFELNRNFRNEGISIRHNPEFTMCEFYWAYATFYDLMDLTEELFSTIATEVCGSPIITYQGTELDLTPGKWQRLTFHESLEKIGGHSPEFYNDFDKVLAYVRERGKRSLRRTSSASCRPSFLTSTSSPSSSPPRSSTTTPRRSLRWRAATRITRTLRTVSSSSSWAANTATRSRNSTIPSTSVCVLNSRSARRRPATTKPARWTKITCARWNTVCPRPRAKASASTGWSCS